MKKLFIVLAIVILALLLGAFLKKGAEVKAPEDELQANAMEEENKKEAQSGEAQSADSTHTLTQAEASYTVDKMWFSKPVEKVTGSTTNVEGSLSFDAETNTLTALSVEIDDQTFSTGSGGRDKDVKKLFEQTGNMTIELVSPVKVSGQEFTATVPVVLQINGAKKQVNFTVDGQVLTSGDIAATGTATIDMTEWGVEPPSAFEVFTVDSEAVLTFEMTAQKAK